jgi:cytochrome b subunit of formate dehydrogenase
MTNAKNLPKTCGACHPGAGTRFALGKVHLVEGQSEPPSVHWIRWAYLLIIPLTIGYMILHHGGDWVRKLWRMRIKPTGMGPIYPVRNPEIRMYPLERVQHFLLLVSFITLAWSGFALKYPDQFWAKPLVSLEGVYPLRGLIHRTAAVIMTLVGVIHVLCLIFSKKLREHWMEMVPVLRDAHDAVAVLFYNLGLTKKKPVVAAHGYVEKMEYWAVVWGTFVMGLTGFILWANNWTLRFIPKEWIDAATSVHFYEAVLASLAILVWHFYTVIFDPDVYPMDTAWLNGKSVRKRDSHHGHPAVETKTEPTAAKGD